MTEEQVDLLETFATTVDASPLTTFWPSPVLEDALDDDARMQVWRLPNRLGKTRHAMYKAAKRAATVPKSRVRVIGPTARQTQDVMGRYLAEFLSGYLAPGSYYLDGKGWNTNTIRLANGSIIQLKSMEDHPNAHAGDELDLVVIDEPPSRPILTENIARTMSRQGQVLLTLTPVGREVGWLRELVESETSPWKEYHAVFSHDNAPWYSPEQVEGWLELMRAAPWEWAQRVEGAWEGYEVERMFTSFTGASVVDTDPPGTCKVCVMMDHGEQVGHEVVLLCAYQGSRVWVLDEYVNLDASSPQADAHAILRMLGEARIDPVDVDLAVGDINSSGKMGAGWSVNQVIEHALQVELGRRTPPFKIGTPDKTPGSREWGLRVISYALQRGELKVHSRCKGLIRALQGWKGTTRGDDGKLAHWVDALRYGMIAMLGDQPMVQRLRLS